MTYYSARLKNLFRLQWLISGYLPVIIISAFLYTFIIKVSAKREIGRIALTHDFIIRDIYHELDKNSSDNLSFTDAEIEKSQTVKPAGVVLSPDTEKSYDIFTDLHKGRQALKLIRDVFERSQTLIKGSLLLLSPEGEVICSSAEEINKDIRLDISQGKTRGFSLFINEGKERKVVVYTALKKPDHKAPLYLASVRGARDIFYLSGFLNAVILMILPMLFIIIYFFNYYIKKSVFEPLESILNASRKIKDGLFEERSNVTLNNEIGELSRYFDDMLEKLTAEIRLRETAEKKAKELNAELDSKVKIRTRELSDLSCYLEVLLEALPVGVIRCNRAGEVQYTNKAADQLIDKKIKLDINQFIPFNEIISNRENQDKNELRGETVFIRSNGCKQVIGYNLSLISLENSEADEYVLVIDDLSEMKKLERKKAESEKMYSYGVLATGMAHDYANILNRIKMAVDILPKCSGRSEINEIRNELDYAVSEGRRLTQSLIAFSGHDEPVLIPVNLNSFLMDFLSRKKIFMQRSRSSVTIKCDKKLKIMAEPNYLYQIFTNLMENSIKASAQEAKIEIRAEVLKGSVNIKFSDNGRGIPDDKQDKIFEPFYSSGRESSWGLGLALVKKLVEQIDGSINYQPVSEGSLFIIKVPLVKGIN